MDDGSRPMWGGGSRLFIEVTMLVISLPVLRDTVSTLNPTDGFGLQFSGGFESSVK